MNFILFNLNLLIAGFVAVFVFSLGLMACVAPLALFAKSDKGPPPVIAFPLIGLAAVYQIYFWGFWAAFCVATTLRFTQKMDVTWDWLYWITGLLECSSLIGWLSHKERQATPSFTEAHRIEKGATFYGLIAIVAFLLFAFAPHLMSVPYGWALKPLGLESFTTERDHTQIDEETRRSLEEFFLGYERAVGASKLARALLNSKDPFADFERVKSLLNESKARLSRCERQVLNDIYPKWGDIVEDKFIPAIDLLLAGLHPRGDRAYLAKGDSLIAEVNTWLENNWSNILLRLNNQYGYPIK